MTIKCAIDRRAVGSETRDRWSPFVVSHWIGVEPTHLMSRGAMMSRAPLEPRDPWLVMVYLAGDNNLSEDMVLALQDLKAEGPPR